MADRHHNLYDHDRWRRYRTWLLFPGTVCTLSGLFLNLRGQPQAAYNWFLVATACYGLAGSVWLRQRFSYVRLEGDNLLVRVMAVRQRLDIQRIRRIRTGNLLGAFEKPDRRRYRPRPAGRWRQTEAVLIRLHEPDDGRLRRTLGRRCVFDDEVILPVADAAGLCREVEALLAPRPVPQVGARRGDRRGRRRR